MRRCTWVLFCLLLIAMTGAATGCGGISSTLHDTMPDGTETSSFPFLFEWIKPGLTPKPKENMNITIPNVHVMNVTPLGNGSAMATLLCGLIGDGHFVMGDEYQDYVQIGIFRFWMPRYRRQDP